MTCYIASWVRNHNHQHDYSSHPHHSVCARKPNQPHRPRQKNRIPHAHASIQHHPPPDAAETHAIRTPAPRPPQVRADVSSPHPDRRDHTITSTSITASSASNAATAPHPQPFGTNSAADPNTSATAPTIHADGAKPVRRNLSPLRHHKRRNHQQRDHHRRPNKLRHRSQKVILLVPDRRVCARSKQKHQSPPPPAPHGPATASAPDPARMPQPVQSASRCSRSHAPSTSTASTTRQFPAKEYMPASAIQDSASDSSD